MSKIEFDVDDKVLVELGEDKIKENFNEFLKLNLMKDLLKKISASIDLSKTDYDKEVEKIREESWKEYKEGLL